MLYTPVHSLIDQSLRSRLGAETTNGDGFGVGWYDAAPAPGVFRSIEPAWNDQNLRELAGHIRSHLPIGDLPGAWVEMPEASYAVAAKGGEQLLPFAPKPPPKAR